MDPEVLHDWLIPIHGVAGVITLGLALATVAVPKRAPLHPRLGRSALVAMGVAIAIAAPVIAARENLFLVGMGLLVAHHGLTAWRAATRRRSGPTSTDRWIQLGAVAIYLAFGAWGLVLANRGVGMGAVPPVMAGIGCFSASRAGRWIRDPTPGSWLGVHVAGAAGFLIAGVTAFSAATGPRLVPSAPPVLLWLGPTVVLTPVFVYLGRRERAARA